MKIQRFRGSEVQRFRFRGSEVLVLRFPEFRGSIASFEVSEP